MGAHVQEQIKHIVESMYSVADILDSLGLNSSIPFIGEENDTKDAMQMDMLLFLTEVNALDERFDSNAREYINNCLDYNFTDLTLEIARRQALDNDVPKVFVLLPALMLADAIIGDCNLSTAYVKMMSYVSIGFLQGLDELSVEKIVKHFRYIGYAYEQIEKAFDYKIEEDYFDVIDDDKKELIRLAVKVDIEINPTIEKFEHIERAVENIKRKREESNVQDDQEYEEEPYIIKDAGDGSDLMSETSHADKNDYLCELDSLIGLKEVKKQINSMLNVHIVQQKCEELGINRQPVAKHMVFTGNPGTGKTTVARIVANVFKDMGVLSKGHLVEVSRVDLVGKYVGHTAKMVQETVNKAKGGVLFIDEAYALTHEDGGGFGTEAIETLIKAMEDNRDDLVVIVAGYPELMYEFLESNPGLKSRFPSIISFPDYTVDELTSIFRSFCKDNDIELRRSVIQEVKNHFLEETKRKPRDFGNARTVRNYFEKALVNQANRIVEEEDFDEHNLKRLKIVDLPVKKMFSLNAVGI